MIALLLRATRTHADFACFFAVKRDHAVGRLALVGDTVDRERIAKVRIPLSGGAVGRVVAGASTDPVPGGEELGRRLGGSKGAVVLPVPVGGRVVGIVVGHCGDVELPAAELSPLVPVARAAGGALERLIVRAKEAGAADTSRAEELARAEKWAELVELLGRQAAAPGASEDEQIELHARIADIEANKLARVPEAIEAWRRVLAIDAGDPRALDGLAALLERSARWEELVDLLEKRALLVDSTEERVATLVRLAGVLNDRLGDRARAVKVHERVAALDPANPASQDMLELFYRAEGRWTEVCDLLLEQAARASSGMKGKILAEVARIYEDEIGDPVSAVAVWQTAGAPEVAALPVDASPGHVESWRALAAIAELRLADRERALKAYRRILDIDPLDLRALDAAARLHEQAKRWREAAELLGRLVDAAPPSSELVDVHRRLGRVHVELGDPARAEESLARALELDPSNDGTRDRLVALLAAAGGEERWLRVEALAPEHPAAAEALGTIYFDRQEWAKCQPRLDVSIRHAEAGAPDRARLLDLHGRAARCAVELGELDRAARHLEAAYAVDPSHLPTLLVRAHTLHQLERWEEAVKVDQAILLQRDKLPAPEVARITRRQAGAWHKLGEPRRAADLLVRALEIEPGDDGALKLLAELQMAKGDWDGAIDALRRRMPGAPPDERVKLLDEIGGIYREELGNLPRALSSWREALEIDAQNHRILQKVLDAHTEAGEWRKAVDTIQRFLDLETDPAKRGAYHQAAGAIHRERLNSAEDALACYERALDDFFADPAALPDATRTRALAAFREIDELLTQKKDWKAQERAYRRMIKRMPPGDPALPALWHNLGEVCRSRLDHVETAIEAFQIAQELDPANAERKRILGELYLKSGAGRIDSAIAHHLGLLREEPGRPDLHRALYRIYRDAGEVDKAWCVARALVHLGAADAEERELVERLQPADFVMSPSVMTEEVWRHVYHAEESRYISSIFWLVWRAIALSRAQSHRALGLGRLGRVLVEKDTGQFSRLFLYVAKTLAMDPPDLFVEQKHGVMLVANCVDKGELRPGLIVRKNLLGVRSRRQIVFALARQLARMRPEHYLKLALSSTAELKGALLAAVVLIKQGFVVPPELADTVSSFLPYLQKHLAPRRLEELALVVDRFIQHEGTVDLDRWGRAVEATAHRVALILCGDLKTAASLVTQERTVAGGLEPRQKMEELLLYSVSEDYFAARRIMGIQVR